MKDDLITLWREKVGKSIWSICISVHSTLSWRTVKSEIIIPTMMKNVNGKRKKKHGELGRINKNCLSFAFAELQNNMVKKSTTGTTKQIEC